jgi:hypothetical protein
MTLRATAPPKSPAVMPALLGGGPMKTFSRLARDLGLHAATLGRWRHPGIIGPEGKRVCLCAMRLGGRWVSTSGELERFLGILNAGRATVTSANRSPAARTKAAAAASRELDSLGL